MILQSNSSTGRRRTARPFILAATLAGAVLAQGAAHAATIAPASYAFDKAADCGSWCYYDSTGVELTDGALGYAGWAVNDGAPWVGWTDAEVNIDFAFSVPYAFTSVSVGSTQDTLLDVVLPNISIFSSDDQNAWTFRGALVTAPSNANNNDAFSTEPHVFLTVSNLDFTAAFVRVQLNSNCCFMFADEVRFSGAAVMGGVPEPSVWAMMTLGFAAAGAMVRRRRTATI